MIGPAEEALRADFEHRRLPEEGFSHRAHLRLAWTYLKLFDLPEAAARLTRGLRALTQALGQPQKYHETITWAFLVLVQDRMASLAEDHDWRTFEAAHEDLVVRGKDVLLDYYRASTLESERARKTFLWPDCVGVT